MLRPATDWTSVRRQKSFRSKPPSSSCEPAVSDDAEAQRGHLERVESERRDGVRERTHLSAAPVERGVRKLQDLGGERRVVADHLPQGFQIDPLLLREADDFEGDRRQARKLLGVGTIGV
jgi:hypothetical protein